MLKKKSHEDRIQLIDATRGIAITLMVAYHIIFDLRTIFDLELNPYSGFWFYEGRLSVILFILISGVSTGLLYKKSENFKLFLKKNTRRSLIIFLWAIVITLVTYRVNKNMTIHFGILHFLAFATILSTIVVRKQSLWLFVSGILVIIISQHLTSSFPESNLFLPLGSHGTGYSTWDWYPLLPWFGLSLIGLSVGKKISWLQIQKLKSPPALNWIGRKSLIIYLLHQPVIWTAITTFKNLQ